MKKPAIEVPALPSAVAMTIEMLPIPPATPAESARADASGAALMNIEWWPIDRLIPYKRNARKWSGQAITKCAASIREFGWQQPLVCDAQDVIVIGHLRQAAARYLGLSEVPVHVADNLSPAQIKALRIADNRTHGEATWDTKLLGVELIELKVEQFDLDVTGFEEIEIIESVFGGGKAKKKQKQTAQDDLTFDPKFLVLIECRDEQEQTALLDRLIGDGLVCKALNR